MKARTPRWTMPSLILTKTPDGSATGITHVLNRDTLTIGRSPDVCRIVLDGHAVSRTHAKIVSANGQYFIEDLKSRNKTFVNTKEVIGRWPTALKNGDNIKICDFIFAYRDEQTARPDEAFDLPNGGENGEDEGPSNTTVEATFQRLPPKQFLDVQPSEKLRAIIDISTALSRTLDVKALLPKIADELFKVFRQADRCFIITLDENAKLIPVVSKSRRPNLAGEQFSRTIVKKCLKTLESYLSEDASSDTNVALAQSIADMRIRSVMCVPLATADGQALGVIQLDCQDRTKKFSQDDLKLLICVAGQASIAIENAKLHETILGQKQLEEENLAAKKVQEGFLPQKSPLLPGYEFFAHYTAARTVGGDYYDFISLRDGRQAVLLGDVSGKGVPAALLMARLSGEARVSMLTTLDVAEAITHLNEQLMQANLEDRYVTLSAAVIDPKTHRVQLVNAGHLSPWIYRQAEQRLEKVFDKDTGDFPVGWVAFHKYTAHNVDLGPGDTLIIYTDGIEDAQPASGQRFTEAGVVKTVEAAISGKEPMTARALGASIMQAVHDHVGNHPQFDDIALVSFGRVTHSIEATTMPTAHRNNAADIHL